MSPRSLLIRLGLALLLIGVFLWAAATFRNNPPGAACLVGTLVILGFAVFVVRQGPQLALNRAFALYSLAGAFYLTTAYLLHVAVSLGMENVRTGVWIFRNGLLLVPPAMMHFTYHFTGARSRLLRVLTWVSLATMAPFLIANALGLYVTDYARQGWAYVPAGNMTMYGVASVVTIFWALCSGAAVTVRCCLAGRGHRGQYVLFLIGWSVAIVYAFLGYFAAFLHRPFPSLTGLSWTIFIALLAFAVVRFNLFDIKVVIRRTLPYAAGTALIGIVYAACLSGLQLLGARLDLLPRGTQWVVFLILVGLAFQPTLEGLQRLLDRVFFHVEAELDRFLAEAASRYGAARSRAELADIVAADARQALKLERAALMLGGPEVSVLSGSPDDGPWEAAVGLPLPPPPLKRETLLAGESGLQLPGGDPGPLSSVLDGAGARAAVPFGSGELRGLLACGEKLSHLAFTSRDRTFLSALAGQAETALARLEARSDADALERLTEAVFQSMTNAVAVIDGSGAVLRCNPEFTRMFGPARGRALREIGLKAVLDASGPGPREIEVDDRTLLVTSRPLSGGSGRGRTVLVLVDVTELRRLQELSRRRAALAEIGATVSSINHEIGNIISPLNHYIDRARRAPDAVKAAEYLEAAHKRIKSLDGLTRELRAYYRQPDLSLRSVVLRDIVEGTLADLRASAGEDWVPPETSGLELTISADPQKAKQVFLNVLKNSWEAMAGSEARNWSVSARRANGLVIAEIRDSGPGIAPEHMSRLFEPFFTTKRERGTGLGLAITRRIVEAHGGELTAESRPGEGATFFVHWPSPA